MIAFLTASGRDGKDVAITLIKEALERYTAKRGRLSFGYCMFEFEVGETIGLTEVSC